MRCSACESASEDTIHLRHDHHGSADDEGHIDHHHDDFDSVVVQARRAVARTDHRRVAGARRRQHDLSREGFRRAAGCADAARRAGRGPPLRQLLRPALGVERSGEPVRPDRRRPRSAGAANGVARPRSDRPSTMHLLRTTPGGFVDDAAGRRAHRADARADRRAQFRRHHALAARERFSAPGGGFSCGAAGEPVRSCGNRRRWISTSTTCCAMRAS